MLKIIEGITEVNVAIILMGGGLSTLSTFFVHFRNLAVPWTKWTKKVDKIFSPKIRNLICYKSLEIGYLEFI